MKYRELLSLTNEEVEGFLNDLFGEELIEIISIEKNYNLNEIYCELILSWITINEDGKECEVHLEDNIELSEGEINVSFGLNVKDQRLWKYFCHAKGINSYLKDNPYLKN